MAAQAAWDRRRAGGAWAGPGEKDWARQIALGVRAGRNLQVEHIEAEEQILAEMAAAHHLPAPGGWR
jgi:hypothetical protein